MKRPFGPHLCAASLLSVACALPARTRPDAKPCTGQSYLDVQNSLSVDVDLYAGGPSSEASVFLGSASPGHSRLPVSRVPGYVYAMNPTGQRISLYPPTSGVRVRPTCER